MEPQILIPEDKARDAELVERALRKSSADARVKVVRAREVLLAAP